jgi:transcriptional regulator with XRE-family HTH domain
MNPSQYSKIEKGKVDPQFSTIEKSAKALKINIVDLVAAKNIFKDVSAYKTLNAAAVPRLIKSSPYFHWNKHFLN